MQRCCVGDPAGRGGQTSSPRQANRDLQPRGQAPLRTVLLATTELGFHDSQEGSPRPQNEAPVLRTCGVWLGMTGLPLSDPHEHQKGSPRLLDHLPKISKSSASAQDVLFADNYRVSRARCPPTGPPPSREIRSDQAPTLVPGRVAAFCWAKKPTKLEKTR